MMGGASPHDDLGADGGAVVEIDDVFVEKADASRRHIASDRTGLVGAVDALERVLPALVKVERAGA